MPSDQSVQQAYALAVESYAALGVDVLAATQRVEAIALSLHCWQGDDVGGFEKTGSALGGGIAVTGQYPGKARNADELRGDIAQALALIPGKHRLSLHASYAETSGRPVERTDLEPRHFQAWIEWASSQGLGLDFNPTYFSHPKAVDGFTLAHSDPGIRDFWIEHGIASRRVGAAMGKALGKACVTNFWIPDGFKDTPVDRFRPRERLVQSLDRIFREAIDPSLNRDALECKLFGLGSESYVVGSHEFYLGYAIRNRKMICLDAGHFHPTETISDKISSALLWLDEILLHMSRGVRWDSDHVVTLSEDVQAVAQEILRARFDRRVHIGLDFFDASINRIAAWVIGSRSVAKALLLAALEPLAELARRESAGDYTGRLALLEEAKTLPFGAVWDYYCLQNNVPRGEDWLREVRRYEKTVLAHR
ncbi:MAG: L-rhamnose isomerase [Verrucomicrobia bacterium]|nr:L-rhamnose isomerase [Verrucomicrobiota bacterium]